MRDQLLVLLYVTVYNSEPTNLNIWVENFTIRDVDKPLNFIARILYTSQYI